MTEPDQFSRYCVKCASLFYQGAGDVCPKDHGAHAGRRLVLLPAENTTDVGRVAGKVVPMLQVRRALFRRLFR